MNNILLTEIEKLNKTESLIESLYSHNPEKLKKLNKQKEIFRQFKSLSQHELHLRDALEDCSSEMDKLWEMISEYFNLENEEEKNRGAA